VILRIKGWLEDTAMQGASTVDDKWLRCPRCRVRSTIQGAIDLRPGVQYLTLRCIACGVVHDAQIPSDLATASPTSLPAAVADPLRP
jgi:transcription elongation factor Elf1